MNRRTFLKLFSTGMIVAAGGQFVWRSREQMVSPVYEDMSSSALELSESIQYLTTSAPDPAKWVQAFREKQAQVVLVEQNPSLVEKPVGTKMYLTKMQNFENSHREDVFLDEHTYPILVSAFKRLDRVQNLVGHGNFNILSFDDMRKFSRQYDSVGAFTKIELDFLEDIFSDNVSRYGFYGDKVITELTAIISNNERVKIRSTGHYLFKGDSLELYRKVQNDLGNNIFLTSGIRSIVKQTHLFFAKTIQAKGNLSLASRSLAPPGHSFHGIGDFDVGKVGFGRRNFTIDFAETDEFKKLVDLGYVKMRYPEDNLLGVRYEPWHIKVV